MAYAEHMQKVSSSSDVRISKRLYTDGLLPVYLFTAPINESEFQQLSKKRKLFFLVAKDIFISGLIILRRC